MLAVSTCVPAFRFPFAVRLWTPCMYSCMSVWYYGRYGTRIDHGALMKVTCRAYGTQYPRATLLRLRFRFLLPRNPTRYTPLTCEVTPGDPIVLVTVRVRWFVKSPQRNPPLPRRPIRASARHLAASHRLCRQQCCDDQSGRCTCASPPRSPNRRRRRRSTRRTPMSELRLC